MSGSEMWLRRKPDVVQKGIAMKMGLDIASVAYKKQARNTGLPRASLFLS